MSKAPYSKFRKAGEFVFVSGQTGFNPADRTIGETIEEQTEQALKNIREVLKEAGARIDDVVKCSVFLRDMSDFRNMNNAYVKFFSGPPPARTTVAVNLSSPKMKIEIDVVAYVPQS